MTDTIMAPNCIKAQYQMHQYIRIAAGYNAQTTKCVGQLKNKLTETPLDYHKIFKFKINSSLL